MIIQLTRDNYQSILSETGKILVVEFYRKACGHCLSLQKELDILSQEEKDVTFAGVDIEEETELLLRYDIRSVPTVMFIKDGEMKEKLIGYNPKIIITENIKKIR